MTLCRRPHFTGLIGEQGDTIDRSRSWTGAISNRALWRRSVFTCLIVGAILTVINHGDELAGGQFDSTMALQIGLTFLVPLCVATVSGAAAIRQHSEEQRTPLEVRRPADRDTP